MVPGERPQQLPALCAAAVLAARGGVCSLLCFQVFLCFFSPFHISSLQVTEALVSFFFFFPAEVSAVLHHPAPRSCPVLQGLGAVPRQPRWSCCSFPSLCSFGPLAPASRRLRDTAEGKLCRALPSAQACALSALCFWAHRFATCQASFLKRISSSRSLRIEALIKAEIDFLPVGEPSTFCTFPSGEPSARSCGIAAGRGSSAEHQAPLALPRRDQWGCKARLWRGNAEASVHGSPSWDPAYTVNLMHRHLRQPARWGHGFCCRGCVRPSWVPDGFVVLRPARPGSPLRHVNAKRISGSGGSSLTSAGLPGF